jgi:large subunit ribosomal protein L29
MKVQELRKLSDADLAKKERELREELGSLNFQHKLRPLEDTSRLRKIKKDIARLRTVANEKVAG